MTTPIISSESIFYTYAYLRQDGTPYYIGKGSGNRAYNKHLKVKTPPRDRIIILKKELTEDQALKHEEYMINIYGRACNGTGMLANMLNYGNPSALIKNPKEDPEVWAPEILCSILGNRTAACVLLFIEKNNVAHASLIAGTFGFGLNQTQRQLKKFEQNYILVSTRIGTIRQYEFNPRNPTVKNLKKFLAFCLIDAI